MSLRLNPSFGRIQLRSLIGHFSHVARVNLVLDPRLAEMVVELKAEEKPLRELLANAAEQVKAKLFYHRRGYYLSDQPPAWPERPAPPDLSAEQEAALVRAVEGLQDEEYRRREAHAQALLQLGPPAIASLRRRQPLLTDPEQQQQVRALLERLAQQQRLGIGDPALLQALSKRVSLDHSPGSVSTFVRALEVQLETAGVKLELAPDLARKSLYLRLQDVSIEDALFWITLLAGGELTLQPGKVRIASPSDQPLPRERPDQKP